MIRIEGKDDETRKCSCKATLNIVGKSKAVLQYNITYYAQYTEDDKTYVSVNIE